MSIGIYIGVIILGANTLYTIFCLFKEIPMASKGVPLDEWSQVRGVPAAMDTQSLNLNIKKGPWQEWHCLVVSPRKQSPFGQPLACAVTGTRTTCSVLSDSLIWPTCLHNNNRATSANRKSAIKLLRQKSNSRERGTLRSQGNSAC